MKTYLPLITTLGLRLKELNTRTGSDNEYFIIANEIISLTKRIRSNAYETPETHQICAEYILNKLSPSNENLHLFTTYAQDILSNAQQDHNREYQSSGSYMLGYRFSEEEIGADYHLGEAQSLSDTIERRLEGFEQDMSAASSVLKALSLYQQKQEQEQSSKLKIFNALKQYAYGLDGLFKAAGQTDVKFHQVSAAMHATLLDIITSQNIEALRSILGDVVDDSAALAAMSELFSDVVDGTNSAATDAEKNNVLNNYRLVDRDDRFKSYIEKEPATSSFQGQLVINHSFKKKDTLEVGDIVNVVLTINHDDATHLVGVVQAQLEALGLVVGRLTGTANTTERHVSLLLRATFSDELAACVSDINKQLSELSFQTAGDLRVVTPMDIRTSRSAISLVAEESVERLKVFQEMLATAAGYAGNQLPQLHITHGNSPVTPASLSELQVLQAHAPSIHEHLGKFGLDFNTALEVEQEKLMLKTASMSVAPTPSLKTKEAPSKQTTRAFSIGGINFFGGVSDSVTINTHKDGHSVTKDVTGILQKADKDITPEEQAELDATNIKFL
ncbi:MAG: hypothetical protein P1U36_10525 [Legionellaceae bacterium]|nr:hypothetical protein [Legionellaceae bacterium]